MCNFDPGMLQAGGLGGRMYAPQEFGSAFPARHPPDFWPPRTTCLPPHPDFQNLQHPCDLHTFTNFT